MPRILPDGTVIRGPLVKVVPIDRNRRCKDWLGSFLEYVDMAESPDIYKTWTGLSTICAAAQRKVYCEFEFFFYHSNMFVALVGPPGTKKSTAIDQGKKILKRVPNINFTPAAPSIVGVMEKFKEIANREHQSLNAFIREMGSLFENAKDSMAGFLTAIYDGEPDYDKWTRIGGKEEVPFPWLNLIAGTTPAWLGDNISKSMLEGGFVARVLWIYSDEIILKSPRPTGTDRHKKLLEDLTHDLTVISQLEGQFTWDEEAAIWYDHWYMDRRRLPTVVDNRTQGYYMRKAAHLPKVAMAISLARKNDLVLTLDDCLTALMMLHEIEPGMKKAFSAVGGNRLATDLERVLDQIQAAGTAGLSYAVLLTANRHALDQRALDGILSSLEGMAVVRKEVNLQTGKVYKAIM